MVGLRAIDDHSPRDILIVICRNKLKQIDFLFGVKLETEVANVDDLIKKEKVKSVTTLRDKQPEETYM